jgi:CHASE2 domain-containing sensor protein
MRTILVMRRKDYTHAGAIVVIVAGLCILATNVVPFVRLVENSVHDLRIATLTPSVSQSQEIAIVSVTEETLA